MKKDRLIAGAVVLAATVLLGGCDGVYELTDEEEAAVVHYSAHTVSKFNKKQPEGLSDVSGLEAMLAMQEEEEEQEQKEQEEEESKEEQEESPEDASSQDSESGNADASTPASTGIAYVSLNEALQLGGVDAVYRSNEVTQTYQETESYMVSANSGNDLVIIHIDLQNNGSRTADCDILSKMPSFRLTINGETTVSADTTILMNDLGTYQGKMEAGESVGTVLLFQIPQGQIAQISSLDLMVTIGESSATAQLLN